MQILKSRRSRKIFFILNLIVQIISGAASFLFTLFVLAQFGQVERVLRLEFGLLAGAFAEFVRFIVVSVVRQHRVDFHITRNMGKTERTNFLAKFIVYLLKLIAATVIVFLAQFGGLDEIEEIALSKEPAAIAYMVFVFFAVFLNMFTVYIAVVFSDYSKPFKGRKVRFVTEKPLDEEAPFNLGHLGGMSDYCGHASAVLLCVDQPTDYCEATVAALLTGKNGEELWAVVPEHRMLTRKQIAEQLKCYEGEYKLKARSAAIEFYCFVNGNI